MLWVRRPARGAASLPFGVAGELRRKLGPVVTAGLLLFMGALGLSKWVVGVAAEFSAHSLLEQDVITCNSRCNYM